MITENETLRLLEKRHSVRRFAPTPLTDDEKGTILHCAMRAPTAANLQLYHIIEVTDPAVRKQLGQTCNNQPWIETAPYLLVFCADYQRIYDFYYASKVPEKCKEIGTEFILPGEQYLLLATCDSMIAAQNAVIGAESIGISSCYVGHIMDYYEIHKELFNLPKYVYPVTLLAFGHPKEEKDIKTPRFDKKYIFSKDKYHNLSPEELENCFSRFANPPKNNKFNATNKGQFHYLSRHTSSNCYKEGIRSLREALKNWK